MPGFDRTGPMGLGPMTGGGRGYCGRGYGNAPYYGPYGRGAGRGGTPWGGGRGRAFGGGRGWNWRANAAPGYSPGAPPPGAYYGYGPACGPEPPYGAPPPVETDIEGLRAEAEALQAHLRRVEERIANLEKEA